VLSALPALIFPRRSMDITPPLSVLLSSHRSWDTEAFLSLIWDQANHREDPFRILDDYPVKPMKFYKTNLNSEHEFLICEVENRQGQIQSLDFILERTVTMPAESNKPDDDTIDRFLEHPFSRKLVHAIVDTSQIIPLSAIAATAAVVAAPVLAASVITPRSGTSPSSGPILPSVNEGPTLNIPSSHLSTSAALLPIYSLADQTSMTMAEVLQKLSDSHTGQYVSKSLQRSKPPRNSRAQDTFLGSDWLNNPGLGYDLKSGTELGIFEPKNLKLFHIALLAHVTHVQYPLYALFMNQCYWFSSTVFSAAQIIDRDLSLLPCANDISLEDKFKDDSETDQIYLPFHLYMPPEAGRWRGIRISGCKKVVLDAIVEKFHIELKKYTEMVFSVSSELLLFTNFPIG
jgi:hypothetical protein